MNVCDLKHFTPENTVRGKDFIWLSVRFAPFAVYGVTYDEELKRFIRMPQEVAEQISAGAKMLFDNTAGGRVRFCTDSPEIAISATQKNTVLLPHLPLCSQSGFDLYSNDVYKGTFMPKMNIKNGYAAFLTTNGEMAEYTVNFPLYDNVYELYIGLSANAKIEAAPEYKNKKPIVFYGSSITQGASASHSGNCYVSRVCRALNSDYINLGLAANCRGEAAMAEYIAGLDMSAFVMDFDHNCKDANELKLSHKPFFDTVRAKNPTLPIIIMSAPDIISKPDFKERREVIKNTYLSAVSASDKNVSFIDGETLFKGDAFDTCTVDGTHPGDLGFYRMAKVIEKEIKKYL